MTRSTIISRRASAVACKRPAVLGGGMHWHSRFAVGLLLFWGTGCPLEWGKDGFNDRAIRKDTGLIVRRTHCAEGQHEVPPEEKDCPGPNCKPQCKNN